MSPLLLRRACSSLDPDLGFRMINSYALAFGRRHVLDDQSPKTEGALEGTVLVEREATVSTRQGPAKPLLGRQLR